MLSGKRFRLNKETIAVDSSKGTKTAIQIPQDAIIQIVNGPTQADSRMVEVLWDGHPLIMFVEDIQQRGEDVTGKSATA